MADISAKSVMELRARTNAGMMESKKALTEANGDMDAAAELLRKWGAAGADKKLSNEMKEGLVRAKVSDDGKTGVLIRLGCQTDFVARNEGFQKLLSDLLNTAFEHNVHTAAELNAQKYPDGSGRTVEEVLKELIGGTIKENIAVTGLARFHSASGQVGAYVHHNEKVGTMVQVDGANGPVMRALISEIAMHVTAGVPIVASAVNREGMNPEVVEKEKAAAAEGITGKPPQIVEKIVLGKLEKFYQDHVLLEQAFVKDEKKRIKDLVAEAGKAVGAELKVAHFARFKVGEA